MHLGYYRSSDKVTWTEGNVGSDGNILVTGTDKSDSSKKYEMTKIARRKLQPLDKRLERDKAKQHCPVLKYRYESGTNAGACAGNDR